MLGREIAVVTLVLLLAPRPGPAGEAAPAATPRSNVAVLAGLFDFTDDTYRAGELGAQYRGAGRWWIFHAMAGGMLTTDGALHLYAGFGIDVPLGSRFLLRLAFAPGYYRHGGGKDLGDSLEFRSSAELAWRFRNGWRLGLEGYHSSNAGFGDTNPGNNSLLVALTIPLGRAGGVTTTQGLTGASVRSRHSGVR